MGGTYVDHMFGAYFGLAVSLMLGELQCHIALVFFILYVSSISTSIPVGY